MNNEDPFHYLQVDSEQTNQFIDAQNSKFSSFLKFNPKIQSDLKLNYNYERFSVYRYHHPYYYFSYNPGLLNQSILIRQHVETLEQETILDPNAWSEDGTIALSSWTVSKNGNFLCFSKSASGSDWNTIHCMDLRHKSQFPECLEFCKFSSTTFTHDELGTFYQQYPKPVTSSSDLGKETDVLLNPTLKYHVWGTTPEKDVVVYKDDEHPKYMYSTEINHAGNLLFIYVSKDCEPQNLFWIVSLEAYTLPVGEIKINKLIDTWHAEYSYVDDNQGNNGTILFKTNFNAPQHKLIQFNISNNSSTDFITKYPNSAGYAVLQDAFVINKVLCLQWMVDVEGKLTLHQLDGAFIKELNFGKDCVSFSGIHAKYYNTVMVVKISGFTLPGSMYLVDMTGAALGEFTLLRDTNIHMDLSSTATKKEWVKASDGTLIPVFITRDESIHTTGNVPVYLYGYGGFNISLDPYFSMIAAGFLKYCKGIHVVACIRGGGELGEEWHKAGIKRNKKRGLKDFIECAEYLKKTYKTNKLFSHGGSNGGLLTAACAQMSPFSFDAVISDVGVMDMLKYHTYTIGNLLN